MSGWQSLAEWWDSGPKMQAKDRGERDDGPGYMDKLKTPGFDGTVTEEHARSYQKPTPVDVERTETRVSGDEYAQRNDASRDWRIQRAGAEMHWERTVRRISGEEYAREQAAAARDRIKPSHEPAVAREKPEAMRAHDHHQSSFTDRER